MFIRGFVTQRLNGVGVDSGSISESGQTTSRGSGQHITNGIVSIAWQAALQLQITLFAIRHLRVTTA